MAQWLERLTADQQVPGSIRLEVMVYVHDVFRQSNESEISDVHQQELDYKKFS